MAPLHPHSHRSLRSSLLAQQLHLQEADGAGGDAPENRTKVFEEERNETW